MKFRYDIQGLRALAVIVVFIFHLGYMKNGYLGVDIFFVISGFLITGILNKEFLNGSYSIKNFYLRRIRRIIPLVLLINIIAIIIGYIIMLPDDYENLAQSVIATNFFSNNILQYVTTGNYWEVANDFKPLMHTWSLGIEEQYYIIFPLIFILLTKRKNKLFLILLILTIISLLSFVFTKNAGIAFYMLHTRFFELSIGGLVALKKDQLKDNRFLSDLILVLLCIILFFDFGLSNTIKVILSVIFTSILIGINNQNSIANKILSFKPIVFIGTISFSLYMWHQLIFAIYRYLYGSNINFIASVLLFIITFLLSTFSFYFVEDYFRKEKNISTKKLLLLTGSFFIISTVFSLLIYSRGGIIKDFPILNLTNKNAKRGVNSEYNDKIYKLNNSFKTDKIKILIIGDSFGRDWANVLLESSLKNKIEVRYISDVMNDSKADELLKSCNLVFLSYYRFYPLNEFNEFRNKYDFKGSYYIVGVKNFGDNSGIYYNNVNNNPYCEQKAEVQKPILDTNYKMKYCYRSKYVDILEILKDKNDMVNVFTDDCKLISQDTRHLTQAGAIYIGKQINLEKYIKK